jgi:hypothetical protein
MASATRKEIATERVCAGGRTYFFDIKEAADGARYLVISESRQSGDGWKHDRVMVFEEYFDSFRQAFERAAQCLCSPKKAYTVEAVRREHPRAYEPWSSEDDERLKAHFREGFTVPKLAQVFQRKEGAIRSRLAKLGMFAAAE